MDASAPWLQRQLGALLAQRGHAWLLQGPSGLGQYELALALAQAWLCEQPAAQGACGVCPSCHQISSRTHPDLFVLMPEALALERAWPLDEKSQKDIDEKKRKPGRQIQAEDARRMVAFSRTTRSRGALKAVLVFPAEAMNGVTANTLLKTLEEPPGELRFVLASSAADRLLPTIRSRCQTHAMAWPAAHEALPWLAGQGLGADAPGWLRAAGGRPDEALRLAARFGSHTAWRALPAALLRGDASLLAELPPAEVLALLQKICHDLGAVAVGAAPRFFDAADLPARPVPTRRWAEITRELLHHGRSIEHPYHPGLLAEALTSRLGALLH